MRSPIRIYVKYKVPDTRAEVKRRYFESLGLKIKSVELADLYLVDADIPVSMRRKIANLFENETAEQATVNTPPELTAKFDWAIEVGFLPGVTDNVGTTAREAIEDFLKKKFKPGEGVYFSQIFFVSGAGAVKLSRTEAERLAENLYNPLIQRANIKSFEEFKKEKGMGSEAPVVRLAGLAQNRKKGIPEVDLNVSDEELLKIGKEGIKNNEGGRNGPLALDLQSMYAIRDYFRTVKRNPTDLELESLAQTWSEHCKHTIFSDPLDEVKDGLYKTYIKGATNKIRAAKGKKDFCVSVFSDNSGAIEFDDKYLITHKVETHNSPSALDPFGGAITGIVGVNRDTIGFGMGAKPVANVYGFCLADPRDKSILFRDHGQKEKMLSARRIMEGVIAGVNAGGNCSGIPTLQGFLGFNERYRGKPLVFAGTVGLIPRKIGGGKKSYEKEAKPGDYIVMAGGRVGQDGIHGATFSSEEMHSGSPATAVQIGDPITQKKMSDALIKEARDKGLYNSITDDGAGGLSCSVAEMAKECGGCLVDLDKVPLKYPGLEPWKIWISESQERMTLSVPPRAWKKFHSLMISRGVEATIIGKFTDSGKCVVRSGGKTVMDIDMEFLHDGRPEKELYTAVPAISKSEPLPVDVGAGANRGANSRVTTILKDILTRPNIASFEFVSRQYDHEVQAGSVLKPLQGRGQVNADATAFRPLLDSKKGVVLSSGITFSYSELDPYAMAASAIDTAIRGAVAAGAGLDHLAILDNFCWCSSNEPERLYQLKEAVRACYDYAVAYGTPFISGKDSMFNDFKGYDSKGNSLKISIPPTLLISAIGVVPDALKLVSLDLKQAGDIIYLLGETYNELGGSEYAAYMSDSKKHYYSGGDVPRPDAVKNSKLYKKLTSAIRNNLVASAISVGKGGLAVSLARTAMAGNLGVDVSLGGKIDGTIELFSESQGRIVVSVSPSHAKQFEKAMEGVPCNRIGKVSPDTARKEIKILANKNVVKLPLTDALSAYKKTFKNY
jgi:phosphoribosylformylglycinamidine synthase